MVALFEDFRLRRKRKAVIHGYDDLSRLPDLDDLYLRGTVQSPWRGYYAGKVQWGRWQLAGWRIVSLTLRSARRAEALMLDGNESLRAGCWSALRLAAELDKVDQALYSMSGFDGSLNDILQLDSHIDEDMQRERKQLLDQQAKLQAWAESVATEQLRAIFAATLARRQQCLDAGLELWRSIDESRQHLGFIAGARRHIDIVSELGIEVDSSAALEQALSAADEARAIAEAVGSFVMPNLSSLSEPAEIAGGEPELADHELTD